MAFLHDIVFDCRHPASLARFWAAVLDGYAVAPYDDAELERLRALGITDVEDDPTVLVEGPGHPRLFFQQVPEPKAVKNRVHLDVGAADPTAEVERLVALGASVLSTHDEGEHRWVTLADPEGNELCVMG
jgi:Glyoxalase-like domain